MYGFRRGLGPGVSGRAGEAVGGVFQALLEAALREAAAGAFEDEEEDQGTGTKAPVPLSPYPRALPHWSHLLTLV